MGVCNIWLITDSYSKVKVFRMKERNFAYTSDIEYEVQPYGYYSWKSGVNTFLFINSDNVTAHYMNVSYSSN